jgi:hypothetical protein
VFRVIPLKTPKTFFTEIGKSTLKFIGKHKKPQTATAILSKKKTSLEVSQYLTSNYTTEP